MGRICKIYCFSTVKMVVRTRLIVNVHCLSFSELLDSRMYRYTSQ